MKYTQEQLQTKFDEYLRARLEMQIIEAEYESMEDHNTQLRNNDENR